MQGYKTIIGIIITFLGLIGWGDLISTEQASELINLLTQVFGLVFAIYGNYKAHKEIKTLGGYRKNNGVDN